MMSTTVATTDTFAGKGIVLFDGDCPFCRKAVAVLKRFDWFGTLRFHSCRDVEGIPPNSAGLDADRMIDEMHVLTPRRDRAYAGYYAFRWIAGRLPTLWWLFPFLFVPGMPWLGVRTYRWIARNRFHLVPCRDGVCTIPPKKK